MGNNEKGQSLVELALTFTVLMFILTGMVELGIAFFQYVQLRDAVQEGALYGSMNPVDNANIELRARSASNSPIDLMDDAVSISIIVTSAPCEGNSIEVQANYEHRILMPFLPALIGRNTIPLNATVTDTILYPICG